MLQLTDGSGTALGITTGLQFLPVLLLSPYAGVIADRFPKRRLLQLTQATDGGRVPGARPDRRARRGRGLARLRCWRFVFGVGSAFDAPARQSFVSEMVDQDDLTNAVGLNSATFNMARIVGPGARRPDDRRPGRRRRGHRLGDPHQRRVVRRGDLASSSGWTPRCCTRPKPVARTPGMLLEGVRYVRSQPKMLMILVHGVLRRHVRHELPDHLRADGDRGVRQGRRRVRPARLRRWRSARWPAR